MKTQVIYGIKTGPSVSIKDAGKGGSTANIIKNRFPNVKTVSDSLQPIRVDVTRKDKRGAQPQEFTSCAFARAATRCMKAEGAYIGIKTSYLVYPDHAIRFFTPVTVGREIPSFDRHEDFATGIYRLSPVSPSQRLGQPGGHKKAKNKFRKKRNGVLVPMHTHTARTRSED